MGGHFDAVGFGDPALGFEATREHLRAAVQDGRRVAETPGVIYYELETPEGCGLAAATDQAGFLLNGCPYFRGHHLQRVLIEKLSPWDEAEPDQGGAHGRLLSGEGRPEQALLFALPCFAAEVTAGVLGECSLNLVGLGYRATTHASERTMLPDGRPRDYFELSDPARDLPPIRRCNVDCRGRIEEAAFLTNSRTGARLAYARLDCAAARLEVLIDLPSLTSGLAEGGFLEGSFWLVGRLIADQGSAPR